MGLKEKDLANGFSAVFFSAVALRGVASAQDTFKDISTVVRAKALNSQPRDVVKFWDPEQHTYHSFHNRATQKQHTSRARDKLRVRRSTLRAVSCGLWGRRRGGRGRSHGAALGRRRCAGGAVLGGPGGFGHVGRGGRAGSHVAAAPAERPQRLPPL